MLGICLKYDQTNYGSKLQALATVEMLNRLDVDYEIIRYNKKTLRFALKYMLRCCNIVFLNDRYDQLQRIICYRRHPQIKAMVDRRRQLFAQFDVYFAPHFSEVYPSYEALKDACPRRYDRVMVCSDQLWSPSALGSGFYNLMFAPEEMPKCSWASSFGVRYIPWYQVGRTRTYLNRIKNISMRENRGAEIVKELTGRTVPVLMDPVFSFTKEEWEKRIPVMDPGFGRYMFCYFLGDNPEHRKTVKALAQSKGLRIVTLRHLDRFIRTDEDFGDEAPYDVDPADFLNLIRHAECICTDSFHGSAFSIIMEKPFLVFNRYDSTSANSKNSRIDSLCENFNLQGRRFANGMDIEKTMDSPIEYDAVREKLISYRQETEYFLRMALDIQ